MWIRFVNLVDFSLGKTPTRNEPSYWNNGNVPWVSISDMTEKGTIFKTKEQITKKALTDDFNSYLVPKGTLLMSFKLTIGRVSLLGIDAVHNEAIINIVPFIGQDNTIRDYLFYVIGIIATSSNKTSAIKGETLNKGKIEKLLIPLPPLQEQRRIVNQIKLFEPLLFQYEKYENQLSLLEASFEERFKASILQYAIEGKLVKQNPNDEPASKLLDCIKLEKEKLIKEGKIKRSKHDSEIILGDDKNYYEKIPFLWCKCNLSDVAIVRGGKRIPKGMSFSNNVTPFKYIRITDMKNGTVVGNAYIDEKVYNLIKKYFITTDDIYITVAGTIGQVGKIPNEFNNANLTENADKITPVLKEIYDWVYLFLKSPFIIQQIKNLITKTAQPKLAIVRIGGFNLFLPPLNEQKKIVTKINRISYLID